MNVTPRIADCLIEREGDWDIKSLEIDRRKHLLHSVTSASEMHYAEQCFYSSLAPHLLITKNKHLLVLFELLTKPVCRAELRSWPT